MDVKERYKVIELMTIEEAEEIVSMVRHELYPPTNPAVLLRAALSIYILQGWDNRCKDIVGWLLRIKT